MEQDSNWDYIFKISLVGNSGTGKTSISRRFMYNKFNENEGFSVGTEFDDFDTQIDDKKVRVRIWDMSGKSTYSQIGEGHLHHSHGWILVMDVTDK